MNFMEKCLNGEALVDDIDDYVEAWHNGADPGMSLREFLGLTKEEHADWVHDSDAIRTAILARKNGIPFAELRRQDKQSMPRATGT